MGRLTEALRRAADAADREPAQDLNAALNTPPGDMNGATDDLFPIEIPNPAAPAVAADRSASTGEPAGAAVIVAAAATALPATAAVEPATPPVRVDAPHMAPSGNGSRNGQPAPGDTSASSGLFERLDATLAQKIVVDRNIMPVSREQYRRLAATLHHAQEDAGLKVVMVASAVVGEGKTLTASNLALTFSESYKRSVLLIDGDFRRPALHVVFNIDAPYGLSEGLMSVMEQKMPLYRVSERLTILPAGKPSSDPMAGLTSGRMRRVIQEAREAFDWVIVDTPPVGLLPDANLLATMVDGAVLVVRANSTPYHQVVRAIDALDRDRLLGVVLNSVSSPAGSNHNYYSYYQAARTTTDR